MNRIAIIALLILAGCSQGNTEDRLATLERRQNYIFELVWKRPVAASTCMSYTDSFMLCGPNAQGFCECKRKPDAQDIANVAMQKEAERLVEEMKVRESEATPTPTATPTAQTGR
jgi:hypothetical protein